MTKSPFKMAGFSGFGNSPLKQDIDLSKKTDKEIEEIAKRNIDVIKKKGDDYMGDTKDISHETKMEIYGHFRNDSGLVTDSLDASLSEMKKRYKKDLPE